MKRLFFIIALFFSGFAFGAGEFTLTGKIDPKFGDTVIIAVHRSNIPIKDVWDSYKLPLKDGFFSLHWENGPEYQYVFIKTSKNFIPVDDYLMKRGDSIHISYDTSGAVFTGRGNEKWRCYQARWAGAKKTGLIKRIFKYNDVSQKIDWLEELRVQDSVFQPWSAVLPPNEYSIIRAECLAMLMEDRLRISLASAAFSYGVKAYDWIRAESENIDSVIKQFESRYATRDMAIGYHFPGFLGRKMQLDSCELMNRPVRLRWICPALYDRYAIPLAISATLSQLFFNRSDTDWQILAGYVLGQVTDSLRWTVLQHALTSEKRSVPLVDCNFIDLNGETRSLASYQDTVLLLDFWVTGCTGCVSMAPMIHSIAEKFKDRPFKLISICADEDIKSWQRSVKGGLYTNALSTNLYTGGAGLNHPFIRNYFINSYPTFILVDKQNHYKGRVVSEKSTENQKNIEAAIEELF